MVKRTLSIRVLTVCGKVATTRLSVSTLHSAHAGSFLGSKKQEAPTVPQLTFPTVIVLMSKPWQAIQFTREYTETRTMLWAFLSPKNTFIIDYLGAVCTAEPVVKYLRACSDQTATGAFVYSTGGSKAFSSSAISRKLDNSAQVKMVYSD